jgi:hypothetical protein
MCSGRLGRDDDVERFGVISPRLAGVERVPTPPTRDGGAPVECTP